VELLHQREVVSDRVVAYQPLSGADAAQPFVDRRVAGKRAVDGDIVSVRCADLDEVKPGGFVQQAVALGVPD
jgi:hypothetical protein